MFEIHTVGHGGGAADRTSGCVKEQGEGVGQGEADGGMGLTWSGLTL